MSNNIVEMIKRDCDQSAQDVIYSLHALKNEAILITGGTGFVGKWLAEMLIFLNDSHKFNVKVFLLSRRARDLYKRVSHLRECKEIEVIERDIRDVTEIPAEVSYIIHAAASPDNRIHSSDPIQTIDTITRGTNAILSVSSVHKNIKKFLNISSGLIYGSQPLELEKIPESFNGALNCGSITSVYAEAKRCAETICSAYYSLYKIPMITIRPFAFIGPYQGLDKPWAINNFFRDGLSGGPLRILSDGETVRSYMYASDMAFWILRILADGVAGLTYNIGSPYGISLKDLAEKIVSNFPVKPVVRSGILYEGSKYRSRLVPDITLAEKTLGIDLKVSIDEAIKRTLAWYKVVKE